MEENDHRSIGARRHLWHIQEDAPGMVFWHPGGFALYRILEDHIRGRMRKLGYREVRTPQLLPKDLWVRSGHWDKFRQNMFCLEAEDGREMALKPMSCPGHLQIFNDSLRSWRDLPMRYAEFGMCHRDEPSGSMHGLMRTKAFEQDDAHVICREEDVLPEVARFVGLLSEVYDEMGFPKYQVSLSTRPAVRAGDDALWDWAEGQLGEAARACGMDFDIKEGEGAFYGPKLEFALEDRLGRSWQCGTVQLDCVLPGRLGAAYVAPDGSKKVPLMIHHAVFGSMGRFIAMMLEQHEGALPFRFAPEQVAVLPISEAVDGYARECVSAFEAAGLRVAPPASSDTLSRRIMLAHEAGVAVIVVVGKREAEAGNVSLRERDGSQSILPLAEAASILSARA
jgi:threonyl-tRNA synthetase